MGMIKVKAEMIFISRTVYTRHGLNKGSVLHAIFIYFL